MRTQVMGVVFGVGGCQFNESKGKYLNSSKVTGLKGAVQVFREKTPFGKEGC